MSARTWTRGSSAEAGRIEARSERSFFQISSRAPASAAGSLDESSAADCAIHSGVSARTKLDRSPTTKTALIRTAFF